MPLLVANAVGLPFRCFIQSSYLRQNLLLILKHNMLSGVHEVVEIRLQEYGLAVLVPLSQRVNKNVPAQTVK